MLCTLLSMSPSSGIGYMIILNFYFFQKKKHQQYIPCNTVVERLFIYIFWAKCKVQFNFSYALCLFNIYVSNAKE